MKTELLIKKYDGLQLGKQLVFFIILLLLAKPSFSQLTIDTTASAQELVNSIVERGCTVSNIKLKCHPEAIGKFTSASDIGLEKGILLTTGKAALAIGPNNKSNTSYNLGMAGDLQLDTITGAESYDACAIEFDLIPLYDTLQIKYVFGSEEYPEYIGKSFNDIFGFFISGPGIAGVKNIGTDPLKNNKDFVNNTNGINIQYDGFTKPLTAIQAVVPCATYHLKIVIADVTDPIFDSGIFIEAGSIKGAPAVKDAERCGAGLLNLVASVYSGTLNWYTDSIAGTLVYTGTDYAVNLTKTTTFYVETAQPTCSSGRTPVTGTINPEVPKPSITENAGVLSAPAGYTYQWYFNGVALNGETSQTYVPTKVGNFKVTVADTKKCSATSDEYSFVLGMKSVSWDASVVIYPNPANEELYIQTSLNGNKSLTVSIYSVIGKLIYQETYTNNSQAHLINTAAIETNGIYFMKLQSGNESITRKINIHH